MALEQPERRGGNLIFNMPASKRTPVRTKRFIDRLRKTGNISLACKAEGIARNTAYEWRKQEPEFADKWDAAMVEAVDMLEAEAWRRAVTGLRRAKLHNGNVVHWEREYSDTLLIQLLKANRPEKFREQYDVAVSGAIGIEYVNDWRTAPHHPPAVPASGPTDGEDAG